MKDPNLLRLIAVVLAALVAGSVAAWLVRITARSEKATRLADNLRDRVRTWWIMVTVFAVSILIGGATTIVLFALMSFLAFREFITLTPTRRGDHRALFWAFFVIIPFHYFLLAQERYGIFVIFIPVYAFIFIPARIAAAGETEDFLGRTSRIQWGLLTCVYFVSHVPALLLLHVPGYDSGMATLLFFFMLIVQMNDVFQYAVGTLLGKRPIAPSVSPNKTAEGLLGGLALSAATGAALSWATPFQWWAAAALATAVALMGFFGDITMSAIKRDLGVKDYSQTLPGHGGVLDRLDSLAFAAPVFFHVVGYFYANTYGG